jgi:hypothetical protein
MNQQVKEKWLSALRSGDYQQTKSCLHKGDRFCCLGVLCDLYGKEHNVEWKLVDAGIYYEFQDKKAILPLSVRKWADIVSTDPYINSRSSTLGKLNDNGSTFIEIADLIEEHL